MQGAIGLVAVMAVGQMAAVLASQNAAYVDDIFQQVMARMEDSIDPMIHKQQMLRDQEYLQHGPSLMGHQYMTGGAGEGIQRLTPDGKIPNIQEIKTDAHLPAYCDPPNPCPVGYAEKDGCMEDMPNEAAFVRTYQEKQSCMCDKEHMISCPNDDNGHGGDMMSNAIDDMLMSSQDSDMMDDHRIDRVAKKGDTWKTDRNPYLLGDKLHTVAKKAPLI